MPNPSVTVCLANRQRAKMFVEYNSTRRKKERTVRRKRETGQDGGTGRTGKDAERITHDATGNRTDKRERRANGARRNGKTARAGRKRRADGARRNGKTARAGRKRRADGARRNGKTARAGRKPQARRREDRC